MFTRKELRLPETPKGLDPVVTKYLDDSKRAILEYLRNLNTPNSLTLDSATGLDNTPVGATTANTGKFSTLEVVTSSIFPKGPYVPTVTAGTGAFTTVVGAGKYTKIGDMWLIVVLVTITTNGTAASSISFTLPPGLTASARCSFFGRENGSTGKALMGEVQSGGTSVAFVNYDNTYPGSSGATLCLTGIVY